MYVDEELESPDFGAQLVQGGFGDAVGRVQAEAVEQAEELGVEDGRKQLSGGLAHGVYLFWRILHHF
jgi:hypothetical protein